MVHVFELQPKLDFFFSSKGCPESLDRLDLFALLFSKSIKLDICVDQIPVADLRGEAPPPPLKFDLHCFLSHFVSECLKIRLR